MHHIKAFYFIVLIILIGIPLEIQSNNINKTLSYKHFLKGFDYSKHIITVDEFIQKQKLKPTVILDLQPYEQYKNKHIKGAIHLGPDIDENKLEEIIKSKGQTILIYCSNSITEYPTRMISLTHSSIPEFVYLGYKNTYYLDDGFSNKKSLDKLPFTTK